MNIEQEYQITCPYCSSTFTLLLDCSTGDQTMVEDCEVCCQPILLDMHVVQGELTNVEARRENE